MKRVFARRTLTACALAAAAAAVSLPAQAIVVYSGTINLTIPATTTGLYVNVLDGTTYSGPNTFPTLPGPGANFDFNVFGTTTTWTLFSPTASGQSAPSVPVTSRGYVAGTTTGAASALAIGTLISNASVFNTGSPSASALTTGAPVLFGFRFRNENNLADTTDDTVHFGWARVILSAGSGTLVDYAFESTALTGIQAGVVPEPASVALMMGGLAGMLAWRRRQRR